MHYISFFAEKLSGVTCGKQTALPTLRSARRVHGFPTLIIIPDLIVWSIISRILRWIGQVARMGEMKDAYLKCRFLPSAQPPLILTFHVTTIVSWVEKLMR
jgi:hypothetical protein